MKMHIFVSFRTPVNGHVKKRVDDVDTQDTIEKLKLRICSELEQAESETDILYGGKILTGSESLADYGLAAGVTVHAIKAPPPVKSAVPNSPGRSELQTLIRNLQMALVNPHQPVQRYFSSPDTVKNLIESTPALHEDPIAIAILHSPDLLSRLADPKIMHKVFEKHPSLTQAVSTAMKALREKGVTSAGRSGATTAGQGYYSLDRMSDDEDDMMDTGGARAAAHRGPAQPITTNLLATALAAAAGQNVAGTAALDAGGSGTAAAGGAAGGAGISSDFMRQALQQALGGAPLSQPQQQQAPDAESNLQQLREMGITDEAVARQALIAAGGDIQGALEIIFGEPL